MAKHFDQQNRFDISDGMFDQMKVLVTAGMSRDQIWQQIELGRNNLASRLISLVEDDGSKSGSLDEADMVSVVCDTDEQSLSVDLEMEPEESEEEKVQADVEDKLSELSEQVIDHNQDYAEFYDDEDVEQFVNGEVPDEEFDFNQDIDSTDDQDIRYKDFFDPPKKRKRLDSQVEEQDEVLAEEITVSTEQLKELFEDEPEYDELMTSHQRKQLKMKVTIDQLEKNNIQAKPWNLLGEVKSAQRPNNSLLEHSVQFDHASKPVPVITDEVTNNLEDIIKQRIKDYIFDSVERIAEPADVIQPKERSEVNETKNDKSLAQIYEDEFKLSQQKHQQEQQSNLQRLDSKLSQEPKKEHIEIKTLFDELTYTLDSLTQYHFVPKPNESHELIIKQVPAIEMEEIIPVGVSDQQVLAPQEVYNKGGIDKVKTAEDRTQQDKNRLRKLKKARQKAKTQLKQPNTKAAAIKTLQTSETSVKIIGK